ncbi:hypothetical protein HDU82_000902 [Entophlyctis luteolus]|nr:hypothetical protein HDU82_000902 [Entophlyctis luteolus]
MRIIPVAVDVLVVATILAAILRVGRLDLRVERIPNFILRWLIVQLVLIGNAVLDFGISIAAQYPDYFDVRVAKEEEVKSATASALSGLAYALGIGGTEKTPTERRWRESSSPGPGLQPNTDKRRSSSRGQFDAFVGILSFVVTLNLPEHNRFSH